MAAHHNRKPVYYRDNSPNDVNVNDIKDHIYQWYETGNRPTEVENGLAWMPPMENNGDTLVWSDSNTLGYNFIPNAPMFWSDGGVGGEKILQMINHCSNRKSDIQFNDLESGISWILNQSDIYTNLGVSTPANPATGQVTISLYNWNDYANAPSLLGFVVNGDGYGTARNGFSLGPTASWLPVAAGSSSVAGNFNITPMGSVEVLMYMDYFLGSPWTGWHHIYVNDVKWGFVTVTANSGLGVVVRGHVIPGTGQTANLADGDDIKIVTKSATPEQMPEIFPGGGSSSTPSVINNSNYMRIASTSSITANGQVRFSAPNPTSGGVVQVTRYDANGVDYAAQLSNAIANKVAGSSSNTSDITIGFNVELDSNGNVTTVLTGTYGWGMSYAAYDTSTLPTTTPYYNVANPTLKTINGIEVYEFVGSMDTGYSTAGVTDSGTPEPILVSLRHS